MSGAPEAGDLAGRVVDNSARCFEDFSVGQIFRSRVGRTITDVDNAWFTLLTLNTNQLHFNDHYAASTRFGRSLVNSTLTLAIVTGLTVPDTSENAAANLGWEAIKLTKPVFVGDTLWAETEVLHTRESRSDPNVGIVAVRSRGINQRGESVLEFRRTFMAYKRQAAARLSAFPSPTQDWLV
jgi:itaconyl-CoA hydratase